MGDEPITPEVISYEQRVILLIKTWPKWTMLPQDALNHLHIYHAEQDRTDADLIHFIVANGTATYRLRRDLPPHAEGMLAELVTGSADTDLGHRMDDIRNLEAVKIQRGRIVSRF